MTDIIVKSLFREFLQRKQLTNSLSIFDNEFKCDQTITRLDLIQTLGMARIVKRNQQKLNPLKTIIEILVDYIIQKKTQIEALTVTTNTEQIQDITEYQPSGVSRMNKMKKRPQSEYRPKTTHGETLTKQESQKEDYLQIIEEIDLPKPSNIQKQQQQSPPEVHRNDSAQTNKDSLTYSKGSLDVPRAPKSINSDVKLSNLKQSPEIIRQQQSQSQNDLRNEPNNEPKIFTFKRKSENMDHLDISKPEIKMYKRNINYSSIQAPINEQQEIEEEVYQNIQYQQLDIKNHQVEVPENLQRNINYNRYIAFDNRKRKPLLKPITQNIKKLMFQGNQQNLPKSWGQPFIFKGDQTFFGLHQLEGGPCGVMACVQSYYLKHFLFLQKDYESTNVKQNCLIAALSDIFYKINSTKLILAIGTRTSNQSHCAIPIECCDQMEYSIKSYNQLYDVLIDNIQIFLNTNGVALFFYSIILTKGIQEIENEMDLENNPLIGNHGHCTQESVNLMLTGRAVSNCFDGEKMLDNMKLRGIDQKSEIGFLTIFEYLQYIQVGQNLKEPLLPIWVMCKEYHYSVLFGCNNQVIDNTKQLKAELKQFDLVFYDGLNNPDDFIRLTIRRLGAETGVKNKVGIQGLQFEASESVTPLIELVLQSKYGKLELDWNDSMPIL